VHLLTSGGIENWESMSKIEVARRLAGRIAAHFAQDGKA